MDLVVFFWPRGSNFFWTLHVLGHALNCIRGDVLKILYRRFWNYSDYNTTVLTVVNCAICRVSCDAPCLATAHALSQAHVNEPIRGSPSSSTIGVEKIASMGIHYARLRQFHVDIDIMTMSRFKPNRIDVALNVPTSNKFD